MDAARDVGGWLVDKCKASYDTRYGAIVVFGQAVQTRVSKAVYDMFLDVSCSVPKVSRCACVHTFVHVCTRAQRDIHYTVIQNTVKSSSPLRCKIDDLDMKKIKTLFVIK